MQSWRRRTVGLLILVTGLLLLLGGRRWVRSTPSNRALASVQSLNGEVTTFSSIYPAWGPTWLPGSRYLPRGKEVIQVSLEDSQLDNADLGFLKDLPYLRVLNLSGTSLNSQVLQTLPDLNFLRALILNGTAVSVEELQKILKMAPNLNHLSVVGTKLQDENLTILETLPKLIFIDLSDIQITDAGLVHLQGLPNLRSIALNGAQITDAGLKHLLELPNLQNLYLDGTSITPAGLEILQEHPRLRYLSLIGIAIHEDDVWVFTRMKNLDCIRLEEGQLTIEVLRSLKSELPQVQVELMELSR